MVDKTPLEDPNVGTSSAPTSVPPPGPLQAPPKSAVKKYGPYVLAAIIVIVLFAIGYHRAHL